MKPRDSFGVVVRVMGLLSFLIGLFWVCFKTLMLLEFRDTRYSGMFSDGGVSYFSYCYAAIFMLVGYLLMRGANCIVKWLYPGEES